MSKVKTTITKEKITNLATYVNLVSELHNISGLTQATSQLWFRGQDNHDWKLLPTIYRSRNLNYFEREMIRDFKLLTNELIRKIPTNELEWMFLMQHYGLPTRLLDWTESHLVALYFSILNYSNTCDSSVWVLHPWSLNALSLGKKTIPTSSYPGLTEYTLGEPHLHNRKVVGHLPIAIRPIRNSARIVAQKGTFTVHGNHVMPLDKIIEEQNSKDGNKIFLHSLTIDGGSKLKILKELYLAGISYSVLFPEVQGICNDIKIRYSDKVTYDVNLDDLLIGTFSSGISS